MFQCCSLKTSQPRLLPQSSKVCSVHLCLFFCFAYRVIQHHSLKAPILQCSGSSMLSSHIYTWLLKKNIALTIWTLVLKVMSLPFNTLSRFVIAFLPRSKHLLSSWLQSPSAVILEPKKIKSDSVHFSSTYFPLSDGTGSHGQYSLNAEFYASFLTLLFQPHRGAL